MILEAKQVKYHLILFANAYIFRAAFRYCLSNSTKSDSIHVLTAREEKKRFPDKDGRIDEAKIANFNKGQDELAESVLYKYKQFCADEGVSFVGCANAVTYRCFLA